MLNKNQRNNETICVVINNNLICVDEYLDTKYEEKKFEKKLNKAAKVAERDKHHIDDHVFLVNNEYRFQTDH